MYVVGYHHPKGIKVGFNEKTPAEKRQKASAEMRFPGDPVPEAELWKDHVLKAHLNLKWLMTTAQYDLEKMINAPKPLKKVEAVAPPAPSVVSPLASKSKAELIELARERGLPVKGTKDELLARLEGPGAA
jgi:hypothetical protein